MRAGCPTSSEGFYCTAAAHCFCRDSGARNSSTTSPAIVSLVGGRGTRAAHARYRLKHRGASRKSVTPESDVDTVCLWPLWGCDWPAAAKHGLTCTWGPACRPTAYQTLSSTKLQQCLSLYRLYTAICIAPAQLQLEYGIHHITIACKACPRNRNKLSSRKHARQTTADMPLSCMSCK